MTINKRLAIALLIGTALVGTVRGILFDPVGTFGNDILITTTAGNI